MLTQNLEHYLQNNFKKKLSPRTTNHLMFITTAILKHAIEIKKYIGVIPSIKGLTLDNARERYLELEEIKQLIDESKKEAYNDIWLFIKLSLSTGARFTSVLSIKKKDIKLSTGTINIKDFKSNKTYQAYISDTELFNYLENHMKTINLNDTIISVKKNIIQTRLTPILNRLFNDGLEKDDRKNRTVIHTLRHTFASHLAINGTPIFTIQKLMNHKLIEMTMRYAHLAPDSGSNAVKDLYK